MTDQQIVEADLLALRKQLEDAIVSIDHMLTRETITSTLLDPPSVVAAPADRTPGAPAAADPSTAKIP